MKKAGVYEAHTLYQTAEQAVQVMASTQSLEEFGRAWRDFLTAANGIYFKLEAAKDTTSQPWFGRKVQERKNDPLLSYLLHARNAGEHGIAPITGVTGGEQTVKGGGHYVITQDWNERTKPRVAHLGGEPPAIVTAPWKVCLAPVTDRGITYTPPTTHLDQPITDTSPTGWPHGSELSKNPRE
jgi:hypothetical protein